MKMCLPIFSHCCHLVDSEVVLAWPTERMINTRRVMHWEHVFEWRAGMQVDLTRICYENRLRQ
jgi:hypothetical protein